MNGTVTAELPEQHSATAARILAAAEDLLRQRGSKAVTVADVAQRAGVGKGTVYLYWSTKADLLLGLIGRDFLDLAAEFTADLHSDPDLARPSQLFPSLMRRAAHRPFVRAMLRNDDEPLGAVADNPRAAALVDALGPDALMNTLLPVWRENALARTDWPLAEQAHALMALYRGFLLLDSEADANPLSSESPAVLARAITALLGPERPTRAQVHEVAAHGIDFLEHGCDVVRQIIST